MASKPKRPVSMPVKWTPTPPQKDGKMSGVRSTTLNKKY